jgi:hypothetical protein
MKIDKLYILQFIINENTFKSPVLDEHGCKFHADASSLYDVRDKYCHTDYTAVFDGKDGAKAYSYDYILPSSSGVGYYKRDNLIKKNFTADKKINALDLKDSSFYRTPNLALPQTKMQLLKEKYNIKVIRDKAKADYIITSYNYIENAIQSNWRNVYKAKNVKDIYLDKIKNYLSSTALHNVIEFLNHVIAQDGYIMISLDWPYKFKTQSKAAFKSIDDLDGFKYETIKDYNMINFMLNNVNNVVFDKDMIDFCNEDSIILTPEDCKSISQMIKSEDEVTIALALEMMANCNIEKSYDKIALIFAFYENTIRYATNWNTVNIKSLRKQMSDIKPINVNNLNSGHGYNRLIKTLYKKKRLNNFVMSAISNKMCKTILNNIGLTHDTSVFDIKPKDLKLKSEYINDDLPF